MKNYLSSGASYENSCLWNPLIESTSLSRPHGMIKCQLLVDTLFSCRDADPSHEDDSEGLGSSAFKGHSPKSNSTIKPHPWAIFHGMMLILSSSYLMCVALFLWLSAVISSFFYLQARLFSPMNHKIILFGAHSFGLGFFFVSRFWGLGL